ncbi:type II toxin-antitoxin system RelE/ParE family toxin [Alterisphingorhabdus coralli]|uniref:Type II toxin-antitoxin system RelE/ParE family toxin n=1 Tax=Alterisphingorhabdus coralli TaxID=3071408 RepID=A0AA97I1M0_9SPHN|nr:type II toxin-antitoxin system RelE/ParE family toxin [Parasphingorhabdus sp. SCSIO 66989]WOE76187.1 type II toxin-antitoxin system RelE/ParE family toxin [Parasphingorhabdus sp. SCSIO 66989]
MPFDLMWSRVAENDLDEIWYSIAVDDPDAADRQLDRILSVLLKLQDYPEMGRARDDIAPDLRGIAKDNYLILYWANRKMEQVKIMRILHAKRDIAGLFQ